MSEGEFTCPGISEGTSLLEHGFCKSHIKLLNRGYTPADGIARAGK